MEGLQLSLLLALSSDGTNTPPVYVLQTPIYLPSHMLTCLSRSNTELEFVNCHKDLNTTPHVIYKCHTLSFGKSGKAIGNEVLFWQTTCFKCSDFVFYFIILTKKILKLNLHSVFLK